MSPPWHLLHGKPPSRSSLYFILPREYFRSMTIALHLSFCTERRVIGIDVHFSGQGGPDQPISPRRRRLGNVVSSGIFPSRLVIRHRSGILTVPCYLCLSPYPEKQFPSRFPSLQKRNSLSHHAASPPHPLIERRASHRAPLTISFRTN